MDAPRLVIIVIGALFGLGEIGGVQKHCHEHVGLLDHIGAVDAVIAPVLIQGKIRHRNGVDIDSGQAEIALMLLVYQIVPLRKKHMPGDSAPKRPFIRCGKARGVGRLIKRFQCKFKGFFAHEIGVEVVVNH